MLSATRITRIWLLSTTPIAVRIQAADASPAASAVSPVADDNLALDAHTGYDVAVLTVTVCGLVLVHEVHIDRVVRNLFVELCMKMKQRLCGTPEGQGSKILPVRRCASR